MKSGIHLVMLGVLLAALLTGCGGNKSTDPSRAGRLENGDRQLSDGSYVDIYMCRATANGNASIDMSSPSLECLIAVV